MDKATQKAKIYAYCKQHGSITVRDACNLDINSPTKRLSEMRNGSDYNVHDVWEEREKADGEIVRYKRYFISKAEGAVS